MIPETVPARQIDAPCNLHRSPPLFRQRQDRLLILVLMLATLVFLSCASMTSKDFSTPASVDEERLDKFTDALEQLRQDLNIPGMSVALVRRQKVVLSKGFGYADLENKVPATPRTPYNIASLTKPISATVLMKLAESGKLDLDAAMADLLENAVFRRGESTFHGYTSACRAMQEAVSNGSIPIAHLLEDYRCDAEAITVRHHLTHTAQGTPGRQYRYNGFLYGLLAQAAEQASGHGFKDLLVTTVTGPLGMSRTLPNADAAQEDRILAERAKYYRMGDGGQFVPSSYRTQLSAAAGMVSTVLDLAKFDAALDDDHLVSAASREAMFTPAVSDSGQRLPYGLGWFVQEHQGQSLIWHYGWAPGAYSSLIVKVPTTQDTFIMLANSDGASAPFDLGGGDLLASPFAVAFLNHVARIETPERIPFTAAVHHVHEPRGTVNTYLDISLGKGFVGRLPGAVEAIGVTGPDGPLPVDKADFRYFPQFRQFWLRLPGPPKIGTYVFTVATARGSATATDTQTVVTRLPLPDTTSFTPAAHTVLRSPGPTFSWRALDTDSPLYYRLEINERTGGRIYATGYVLDMLEHTIPGGILAPQGAYRWRLRVADAKNHSAIQNRSQSHWIPFEVGSLFAIRREVHAGADVYPDRTWQQAERPELLGFSSAKLRSTRDYSQTIGTAALMIVKDGLVVDAWGEVARKFKIHSMRKPLMSSLVGIYVTEGRIDPSATMADLDIDDNPPTLSPLEKQAKLADLLKSRSGIYHPALGEAPSMKALRPPRHSHAPGTFYYYNNWDFNVVGAVFRQQTREDIFEALARRIAQPLGMEDFQASDGWYEAGDDSIHPYYGLRMSARDLARFGLLYLRQGRWRDHIIVPSAWVRESTATHSTINAYLGYGCMWRTSQDGGPYPNIHVRHRIFGHSGLGMHFFNVMPSQGLVIVHRVNTDIQGQRPSHAQLGRLLWMILDAGGVPDIGENPSLDADPGRRLMANDWTSLLANGPLSVTGLTPPSLVETRDHRFTVSLSPGGALDIAGNRRGTWRFERDRFCVRWNRTGYTTDECFTLTLKDDVLKLYDGEETLQMRLNLERDTKDP